MQHPPLAQARVGIVGLGLMGGSLALALRGRVAHLLAIEPQVVARQMALREGVVDEAAEALTAGTPALSVVRKMSTTTRMTSRVVRLVRVRIRRKLRDLTTES